MTAQSQPASSGPKPTRVIVWYDYI
jgi:hypothetical protein